MPTGSPLNIKGPLGTRCHCPGGLSAGPGSESRQEASAGRHEPTASGRVRQGHAAPELVK